MRMLQATGYKLQAWLAACSLKLEAKFYLWKMKQAIVLFSSLLIFTTGYAKPVHYSFLSKWEIKAPLKEVWDKIEKGEDWHLWWRSVVNSTVLTEGNTNRIGQTIHYKWKSFLPFTLQIDFRITSKELYKEIRGESTGDLIGEGVWTFEEKNGVTYVQYQWEVISTKKFVNFLSHFIKPFFTYSHNVIMRRGEKGLKKELIK